MNVIDHGLNIQSAVAAPRIHHQWLPDEVMVEKEFDLGVAEQLRAMGYTVSDRGPIGRMEVIRILPDGRREAASDPHGDDSVSGF